MWCVLFYSCPPFKDHSKDQDLPNLVSTCPDFESGQPNCNYRVVECKITTTDELVKSAPVSNLYKKERESKQRPVSVTIAIPDEGKG